MKKFEVVLREVHVSKVVVDAASKAEAVRKIKRGEGTELASEYSHTFSDDSWVISQQS